MQKQVKVDVVVIGAGMVGLSTAYELAKLGSKVAVLEKKRLGDSCSVANTGLVLKADARPYLGYELTIESLSYLERLHVELDCDLAYEPVDFLGLLRTEEEMQAGQEQVEIFTSSGFAYRMLSPREVKAREPLLNVAGIRGAVVSAQGKIDPFSLLYGYFKAGRQLGMQWCPEAQVMAIENAGDGVTVYTPQEIFQAQKLVIAAGAWTREIAALAGLDLPQHYVHGETLVTEALPVLLRTVVADGSPERVCLENKVNSIAAAGEWYGSGQHLEITELVVTQVKNGNVLIGQRSHARPFLYDSIAGDSLHLLSRVAALHLPALREAAVIRSWVCPVPFTPDHKPLVGPADKEGRILISSGYLSTLILTPVMAKLVAKMALGLALNHDLSPYSPARFTQPKEAGAGDRPAGAGREEEESDDTDV